MKKFLIIFFIAFSVLGTLLPTSKVSAGHNSIIWGPLIPDYTIPANAPDANVQAMNLKRYHDANGFYYNPDDKNDLDQWVKANPPSANELAEAQAQDKLPKSKCGITNLPACIKEFIFYVIQSIGNFILNIFAWILWLCGGIFNLSIIAVVVNMKNVLGKISVIYVVWRTLRDFANMFFIFILLFIAIQTILQMGDYKKMLRNVILVALFINFSFFFTSVLIDMSNITALMFYKGFATGECQKTAATGVVNAVDGCMSYQIVNSLKLQTLYSTKEKEDGSKPTTSDTSRADKLLNVNDAATGQQVSFLAALGTFIISVIAGSILMIIISGVFLASAVLILYRFVELVMLLMLSPIAFAAIVLPATKKHWNTWWNKLSNQLIFAPAYFMFLWIVMTIITSRDEKTHLGVLQGALNMKEGTDFYSAMNGDMMAMFTLLANYVIVITMLGYSLVLAKELGASGTEMATKVSKGFQGFVGRNTVGKAAYGIANSRVMKNVTANSPTLSKLVSKPMDKLSNYGFGDKDGYAKTMEKRKKSLIETGKRVGESELLTKHKGESDEDFKARQTEADKAGKDRKKVYAEHMSGNDNGFTSRWSRRFGVTAALRSNKEAYQDMSKQFGKDADDKEAKDKRDAEMAKAVSDMHALQQTEMRDADPRLGHHMPIPLKTGEAPKREHLADPAEIKRIKAEEVEVLAGLEAESTTVKSRIEKLDPKSLSYATQMKTLEKQLSDIITKQKKIENNRKAFESLQNTINNLQDKIDRADDTSKLVKAVSSTGAPAAPAPAPAPKPTP